MRIRIKLLPTPPHNPWAYKLYVCDLYYSKYVAIINFDVGQHSPRMGNHAAKYNTILNYAIYYYGL